jgi:hypothetical protein
MALKSSDKVGQIFLWHSNRITGIYWGYVSIGLATFKKGSSNTRV